MRRVILGFGLAMAASLANAADKPVIAPPEPWVKAAGPDTATPPTDSAALKVLLLDQQLRFTDHGDSGYVERRVRIQTAQGLQAMGTVSLPWNPELDTLTIHRLTIERGGKVIDVLAKQSFTVVRRETNLELATLDGVLTAVIQPEDLQVGDVLDLAFTVTRSDPVLKGRSETIISGVPGLPIDHLRIRATWDQPKTMRWRATEGLDGLKSTRAGSASILELDGHNLPTLHPPEGAPARFGHGRELEFTEFGTWADVASLMRPLYEKAATLKPDSPLQAQIVKIKAASSDPKAQAQAALALVQDQVRYVFLGMNDGGYIPADADTTWTRRFGDCKAKTVLLMALLNGLGVSAQPALVSTVAGDGLDARLPSLVPFDHVMVRAVIGGKVYWLDGTRGGDLSLDRLRVPNMHWALPIGERQAGLEPLRPAPLTAPDEETTLALDASGGLDAPAPAHAEMVFRGDAATVYKQAAENLAAADLDRALRQQWTQSYDFIDVAKTSATFDPNTGEERLTMDGTAKIAWDADAGGGARRHEADGAVIGWKPDFRRQASDHPDAPYAVGFPAYTQMRETIILPRGGAGFAVDTQDVDRTVAGQAFKRVSRIDKGVFTMVASVRSLAPEFPASEAQTAAKALTEMSKITAYVRAPADYKPTQQDIAALTSVEPTDVAGYLARAQTLMTSGALDKALSDADHAVALDPKSAQAHAARGWILASRRSDLDKALAELDLSLSLDPTQARIYATRGLLLMRKPSGFAAAKADFDKALSLAPRDPSVLRGAASYAHADGRVSDAIQLYTQLLDLDPNDQAALASRANDYWTAGDTDHALVDTEALLRLEPGRSDIRISRSEIYRQRGEPDKALAEVDAAIARAPTDPHFQIYKAMLLERMGRKAEGRRALDAVIAKTPTAEGYLTRAGQREKSDFSGRLSDINETLKLIPKASNAMVMRAQVQSDQGDYEGAIKTLDAALALYPKEPSLLLARAVTYNKAGRVALAQKELDALRAIAQTNAIQLNQLCWTEATSGMPLPPALDDCEAALKLAPRLAAALDSRAFTLLMMGRLDDALAGFDAALRASPQQAGSLFGRGVTKLRKGMAADGQADLAAARKLSPDIDDEYAEYGLKP